MSAFFAAAWSSLSKSDLFVWMLACGSIQTTRSSKHKTLDQDLCKYYVRTLLGTESPSRLSLVHLPLQACSALEYICLSSSANIHAILQMI